MSMNIYIVCVKCLKLAIVINEDLFNWNGYINILTYNGVLYTYSQSSHSDHKYPYFVCQFLI